MRQLSVPQPSVRPVTESVPRKTSPRKGRRYSFPVRAAGQSPDTAGSSVCQCRSSVRTSTRRGARQSAAARRRSSEGSRSIRRLGLIEKPPCISDQCLSLIKSISVSFPKHKKKTENLQMSRIPAEGNTPGGRGRGGRAHRSHRWFRRQMGKKLFSFRFLRGKVLDFFPRGT